MASREIDLEYESLPTHEKMRQSSRESAGLFAFVMALCLLQTFVMLSLVLVFFLFPPSLEQGEAGQQTESTGRSYGIR